MDKKDFIEYICNLVSSEKVVDEKIRDNIVKIAETVDKDGLVWFSLDFYGLFKIDPQSAVYLLSESNPADYSKLIETIKDIKQVHALQNISYVEGCISPPVEESYKKRKS
ncbi:hypothetical protein DRJ22_04580 [Candidatus Woesearchaeota archaeon]|nr:MAG: hypothetical protein B6U93_01970 [Candidatus Woesearchaeota archaeon ex4484_78]RLE45354.1 MAG: hypothetical protein DRJ22_04580 [Candidatus Woesearchaeota archaeon]